MQTLQQVVVKYWWNGLFDTGLALTYLFQQHNILKALVQDGDDDAFNILRHAIINCFRLLLIELGMQMRTRIFLQANIATSSPLQQEISPSQHNWIF